MGQSCQVSVASCSTSLRCVRRINARACMPPVLPISRPSKRAKTTLPRAIALAMRLTLHPPVPAPEDEAAAEPALRGPVVQELHRALFQQGHCQAN